MNPLVTHQLLQTRRQFFGNTGLRLGGIALAFLTLGSQLWFVSQDFVLLILAPLLLLMTLAFTYGFVRDIKG